MAKRLKILGLLAVLIWASHGNAQVNSGGASVTLRATLQESVSAGYFVSPVAQSFSEYEEFTALALVVGLGWNLMPGHDFHIASSMEGRFGDVISSTQQGPMSLRQLAVASSVFSFMPSPGGQLRFLGAQEVGGENAVGRAAMLMVLPVPRDGEELTVKITVVLL